MAAASVWVSPNSQEPPKSILNPVGYGPGNSCARPAMEIQDVDSDILCAAVFLHPIRVVLVTEEHLQPLGTIKAF